MLWVAINNDYQSILSLYQRSPYTACPGWMKWLSRCRLNKPRRILLRLKIPPVTGNEFKSHFSKCWIDNAVKDKIWAKIDDLKEITNHHGCMIVDLSLFGRELNDKMKNFRGGYTKEKHYDHSNKRTANPILYSMQYFQGIIAVGNLKSFRHPQR